jgi:hypothetical protein
MNPDKIIVSNCDQLISKYKKSGMLRIRAAVNRLIKADASRGIVTVFVDLSDPVTMAAFGAPAIPAANAGDAKLNKQAIDKVFASHDVPPAYLMLLGAVDVIPHVLLNNPLPGDGDTDVPSDLPYANARRRSASGYHQRQNCLLSGEFTGDSHEIHAAVPKRVRRILGHLGQDMAEIY